MSKSKRIKKRPSKFISYLEKYRYYFWFLETTIILGFAYHFGIAYLLQLPIISEHMSNLLGSIILCLIIIGPKAFKEPNNNRIYYAIITVGLLNIILEFTRPISQIHFGKGFMIESFNTPDPWDAFFGLIGIGTVILVSSRLIQKRRS